MDIKQALAIVVNRRNLSREAMREVMRQIMCGGASDAQIGAFLVALRIKGESIDEITGAVEVMRELVKGVEVYGDHLVDIVGTGGDESNLFNVSTAATFVVAAAGGQVAKHGKKAKKAKNTQSSQTKTLKTLENKNKKSKEFSEMGFLGNDPCLHL